MAIRVAVRNDLTVASNGNLRRTTSLSGGYKRFDWFVSYPINNYNVSITVADFAHFSDTYQSADGEELALDYYVLPENLERAKQQFQQVPKMLACFEKYLGKYPFWEDGYALIETPYLGMEHQSGIAYGNQYMRGYLGGMIPRDMEWDYIIIHETGHEYFGNAVSANDHGEMWIHESFTTYLESIYVECVYSYADAMRYLRSQRAMVMNREPMLGPLDVNFEDFTTSDHYFKGALMLNNLRHAINDDEVWFDCLKSFYQRYSVGHAKTQDFIDYVNHCTKADYTAFFEQFLRHPNLPTFEYEIIAVNSQQTELRYRWQADAAHFSMPLLVGQAGGYQQIQPTKKWQTTTLPIAVDDFKIADELFYIKTKLVK
jgi:aminopeptidase N